MNKKMTPETTKNVSPPSRPKKRREPNTEDEDQRPLKKMKFSEAEMIETLNRLKSILRDVKESIYRCETLLYETRNKKKTSIKKNLSKEF